MVPQLARSVSAFAGSATDAYQDFVNPQWVKLLTVLGMNVAYERCSGCELFIKDGPRALELGEMFRARLRQALGNFDLVKDVRGMGLLSDIEFAPPRKLAFRALCEAFHKIHPAMFGQIVVMRMFREKRILTQICGNNFMVLKAAPPLIATEQHLNDFVTAMGEVVEMAETSAAFWTEALGMARRAVNI